MPLAFLASLCEGGGSAGPEGENCAIARNISGCRKLLSPSRCGGSPLSEGAKGKTAYIQEGEIPCSKNSQHWLLRLRSVWVL